MARQNSLFKYGILVVLFVVVIAGAYYFYDKYGYARLSPLDAIPVNTSAFIVVNQPGQLIATLAEKNMIWKDLLKSEPLGEYLQMLSYSDSVLDKGSAHEWFDKGELYLVLSGDSAQLSAGILFEWPYGGQESDIDKLVAELQGKSLQKKKMAFGHYNGYSLSDTNGAVVYYMVSHGLAIIGSTSGFMTDCADRIKSGQGLPSLDNFEKVSATAGRNVHANIYINFRRIGEISDRILASAFRDEKQILPEFGSWAEVDLLIKNEEILLNGYTETIDSLYQYLDIFKGQDPQKIEITRILPYNTSLLLSLGFEDFAALYDRQKAYYSNEGVFISRKSRLETLKRQLGPALEDRMTSWIGNEIALALINPHLRDPQNNSFIAIHARDIEKAVRSLGELSGTSASTDYRGYLIRRIPASGLLPVIFGQLFSAVENNYYTRIEDYIVFANSRSSIENFINILLSGKTLKQNENFKRFTDNVSDRSNLLCYFNIRNSINMLEEVLSPQWAAFVKDNPEVIRNFEALAVQFKWLNNMYFSSVYIKHNPSYINEDLSIWKAYLDAPVYGDPYFVKDHRTNHLKIVTFDTLNNMYLIDHEGNIVWKLNIGEKVISDVHTVDFYKNGKIQYLFNTKNRIYLIDLLGRDVEGYPVELRDQATNGLAVFDYDDNKEYRILIALKDNRIYNYDIRGKKIRGWNNPMTKGMVTKPVQHLRVERKDYIVIADAENNVKITDRRGNPRINLKSKLENGLRSEFYVNETNSKGIILTTDKAGRLVYIKADGRMETTDFGMFSEDHYFLYEDFDNKGGKDFIYLDGNKLTVYDRFKNEMFSHEFENEINSTPLIIPVSAREKLIGVVSEKTGKIYLFDKQGRLLSTPDHRGKTQMLIGSLNRDGQLNMISGSGATIYNYYFR